MNYPSTKQGQDQDNYFGTIIKDAYRWLENDNSAETKAWGVARNKVTEQYLSTIPFSKSLKMRLAELWNYPKYGILFKKGDYLYFYKNDGLQNQNVLYRQKGLHGK